MAEYIERKKVEEMLNQLYYGHGEYWCNALDAAEVCLDNIPSADVRSERHGHWSEKMVAVSLKNKVGYHEDDYEFGFRCSECGGVLNKTAYCGNCGAKMDKDDSDEDEEN